MKYVKKTYSWISLCQIGLLEISVKSKLFWSPVLNLKLPFNLIYFTNKTDRHDIEIWNIVESGVHHHNPNPLHNMHAWNMSKGHINFNGTSKILMLHQYSKYPPKL